MASFRNYYFYFLFAILFFGIVATSCKSDEPLFVEGPNPDSSQNLSQPGEELPENGSDDFILPDLTAPSLVTKLEDLEIEDPINSCTWKYVVYLPPSYYEDSNRKYPVLYFLHGLGNKPLSTSIALGARFTLNYLYHNNLLPEMIVIFPEGGASYWVDDYEEGLKYETFFFTTFIPEVEREFRIDQNLKRYISGFSMGGYGAAHYAFTHPDLFGYCYSMSCTLLGKGVEQTPSILSNLKIEDSPLLSIDVGMDDQFIEVNEFVHLYFKKIGFTHEYIRREGGHEFSFWKIGFYACLLRIGRLDHHQ